MDHLLGKFGRILAGSIVEYLNRALAGGYDFRKSVLRNSRDVGLPVPMARTVAAC